MTYDSRPKWQQIADRIREDIDAGTLKPGDRVPSEAKLTARHGVARGTAHSALDALIKEGLITAGRPRRVARHDRLPVYLTRLGVDRLSPGEAPTGGADSWLADMAAAGQQTTQKIKVVITPAPPATAARLGVAAGESVLARQLVRTAGGEPHNLITFWFPLDIAWGTPLADEASITEGSVAWLEKQHGTLVHEPFATWPRMPTPDEEQQLRIPAGIPVQIVWRASRAAGGRAVVASMAVYRGDRTVLLGT